MTKEPKSDFYRYAYGYSDKKPGKLFWIVMAAIFVIVVAGLALLHP